MEFILVTLSLSAVSVLLFAAIIFEILEYQRVRRAMRQRLNAYQLDKPSHNGVAHSPTPVQAEQ